MLWFLLMLSRGPLICVYVAHKSFLECLQLIPINTHDTRSSMMFSLIIANAKYTWHVWYMVYGMWYILDGDYMCFRFTRFALALIQHKAPSIALDARTSSFGYGEWCLMLITQQLPRSPPSTPPLPLPPPLAFLTNWNICWNIMVLSRLLTRMALRRYFFF